MKKIKLENSRLVLCRETIRALGSIELRAAVGGALPLTSIRTDCNDTRCFPPPPPPL